MSDTNILAPIAALTLPDGADQDRRAQSALRMVQSMQIVTDEDFTFAADELAQIKSKLKDLEAKRTSITGPINKALDAINGLFRGPREILEQAEKVIKAKLLAYQDAKERAAAEAKRQAEEAAAAERARLEAEAESRRLAAEAEAAALAKQAEEAAAAGDLQTMANVNAQQAAVEQQSLLEVAALQQTAAVVTVAPVVNAPARVSGLSTRKKLKGTVTDKVALLKHIVAHIDADPSLGLLVSIDEKKLQAWVTAQGENLKFPGVTVDEVKTIASRAAA